MLDAAEENLFRSAVIVHADFLVLVQHFQNDVDFFAASVSGYRHFAPRTQPIRRESTDLAGIFCLEWLLRCDSRLFRLVTRLTKSESRSTLFC